MPKKGAGTRKGRKKKAALIIQRFAKSWLVHHFYKKFKKEVQSTQRNGREVIREYKRHLMDIMIRHGVDFPVVQIDFWEIYDYLIKKKKYEETFDVYADKEDFIAFNKIGKYFESLNLQVTAGEICYAAEAVVNDKNYKEHKYSKQNILNIALHIFVPRGTHLPVTRKSTWLCPIVGNDDALRSMELKEKDREMIKLSKCTKIVTASINARKQPDEPTGSTD